MLTWCLLLLSGLQTAFAGAPHAAASAATSSASKWQPLKVSLADLQDDARFRQLAHKFEGTLKDSGILAIDMGPEFGALRRRALRASDACSGGAPAAVLGDGTVRRTLAATRDRNGPGALAAECAGVEAESFRARVWAAASGFGARLGGLTARSPILATASGEAYPTVGSVVDQGDHLEHFHSYGLEGPAAAEATVDFHADQGLFIAFTPGLTTTAGAEDVPAATFAVELRDGTVVDVDVDADYYADAVFVMLGDGVDQYVNDGEGAPGLRSAPHALRMVPGLGRSWYGLMILPPKDAVSPQHGALTFGEVRDRARAGNDLALGCSRNLQARELAEAQCEADQMYCWYRCMDLVNHDGEAVSEAICADQGYAFLNCTDVFRQPSDGHKHGDYYPQCTDYTHEATPFPSMAQADEDDCDGLYDAEAAAAAAASDGSVDLVYGGRSWEQAYFTPVTVGKLAWTLSPSGGVSFTHVVKGAVGWMAFGPENPGGHHNGMNGAPIIMTIPDASSVPGFLDVDSYRIHESSSSFRHWYNTTSGAALSATSVDVAEDRCFAKATMTLASYAEDRPVDVDACEAMIWAVSQDSSLASDTLFMARGMHEYRGKFSLNLSHPEGLCFAPEEDEDAVDDDHHHDEEHVPSETSKKSSGGGGIDIVVIVVAALAAVLVVAGVVLAGLHCRAAKASPPEAKPVAVVDEKAAAVQQETKEASV